MVSSGTAPRCLNLCQQLSQRLSHGSPFRLVLTTPAASSVMTKPTAGGRGFMVSSGTAPMCLNWFQQLSQRLSHGSPFRLVETTPAASPVMTKPTAGGGEPLVGSGTTPRCRNLCQQLSQRLPWPHGSPFRLVIPTPAASPVMTKPTAGGLEAVVSLGTTPLCQNLCQQLSQRLPWPHGNPFRSVIPTA